MKCPVDGKELIFSLTMDEGDGDILMPYQYYYCPECTFTLHDYEDEFEYPANYDELVNKLKS